MTEMDGTTIREADGPGAEAFSMPELFYMTHRELIDEWAALAERASRTASSWLSEVVAPEVEALAEEVGWTYEYIRDGRFRIALLFPPNTPHGDKRPLAGVGLGWDTTEVGQSDGRRNSGPYVGVSTSVRTSRGKELREAVQTAGVRRIRDEAGLKKQMPWPAFRHIALPEAWWTSLEETRDLLLTELRSTYALFGSAVAEGVESLRASNR